MSDFQGRQAVEPRQLKVRQNHVEPGLLQRPDEFVPRLNPCEMAHDSLPPQQALDQFPVHRVVF